MTCRGYYPLRRRAGVVSFASRSARMRSRSAEGLVGSSGILGNELAGERLLQDALPQPLDPCQALLDRRLALLDDRETALDLGHNAALLSERRQRYQELLDA